MTNQSPLALLCTLFPSTRTLKVLQEMPETKLRAETKSSLGQHDQDVLSRFLDRLDDLSTMLEFLVEFSKQTLEGKDKIRQALRKPTESSILYSAHPAILEFLQNFSEQSPAKHDILRQKVHDYVKGFGSNTTAYQRELRLGIEIFKAEQKILKAEQWINKADQEIKRADLVMEFLECWKKEDRGEPVRDDTVMHVKDGIKKVASTNAGES